MNVILLKNDGRCRWFENKIMKGVFPEMAANAKKPDGPNEFLIIDWVSNDNGKVGIDLDWLDSVGVPAVQTIHDLPDENAVVVNTGYDSIVSEEKILRDKGVEIVDLPCPYARKLRKIFEAHDPESQYVLLCEPNHIIVKNFQSIFPKDMILVQMENYKERIQREQNGKPLVLVPYVTFLPSSIARLDAFIQSNWPERTNQTLETCCMWIKSPVSPIIEIQNMDEKKLEKVTDALLISTPGSVNKSLVSLMETIAAKGLKVHIISSLDMFRAFQSANPDDTVLLVRSPIPNEAEEPIMTVVREENLVHKAA